MRKKTKKAAIKASLALPLLAAAGLIPQQAAALSINCNQPLEFGNAIACGSPGSITVRPDGSQTSSGCITLAGSPYSNANCFINQSYPYQAIQISVAAGSYPLSNGGDTMMVNNFNVMTNAGGQTYTITATPFATVPIGATLNIGANQAGGTYSGTFTVNVVLQ